MRRDALARTGPGLGGPARGDHLARYQLFLSLEASP